MTATRRRRTSPRARSIFLLIQSLIWTHTKLLSLLLRASADVVSVVPPQNLTIQRPPVNQRKFRSAAVDDSIDALYPRFKDHDIATLFTNCFPNTLDTTIASFNETDTFVITGDINAMWLRDSCNQVLPYMRFVKNDSALSQMLCGVVRRQAYSVLLHPFANAFNYNDSGAGHQDDVVRPPMLPGVFEAKYELDSLAAFLKTSRSYWEASQNTACFTGSSTWLNAVKKVLDVVEVQQAGTQEGVDRPEGPAYCFSRTTTVATDTLMQAGIGVSARRCGLSKCSFRGSDDAVTLPFLIPANAMLVTELQHIAKMLPQLYPSSSSPPSDITSPAHRTTKEEEKVIDSRRGRNAAEVEGVGLRALSLAQTIDAALHNHAIVLHRDLGAKIWAYEVDGYGSSYTMDDANIPSLLSLPYLGYTTITDPIYQATRKFVLSPSNPFYFNGSAGAGIGGPHIGPGYIWPMSLIMQALTTENDEEIKHILEVLKLSSAGTGFIHESYHKDNPANFTRPWFAWVNGLFGELILKLIDEKPWLVLKDTFKPKALGGARRRL